MKVENTQKQDYLMKSADSLWKRRFGISLLVNKERLDQFIYRNTDQKVIDNLH